MAEHRLLFVKEGRACYISHLDLMRTFQRAFFRAGIPIKHTEGFHPHAFISIALPLSLGYASRCELLEFTLLDGAPEKVPEKLNPVLPEGIRVLDCYTGGRPIKELAFVDYEVALEYPEEKVISRAQAALEELLGRESVIVRKRSKKAKSGWTEVDIIPRIRSWAVERRPGALVLEGVLAAQNPGLNPELICAALQQEHPDCAPGFPRFLRREVLDGDGKVFR